MTIASLEDQYADLRQRTLLPLAARLEEYIGRCLQSISHIDRITARAKSVERFVQKAARSESGAPKYTHPLSQIQDQLGARVVVFYLADVATTSTLIEKFFRPIESQNIVPDTENEFGYFGKHYVLLMPTDLYDGQTLHVGQGPKFFELQVKTLFQHAWSEAEHDLGYKPSAPLSSEQKRRIAFTAAQAWGADIIFDELHRKLDS